MIAVMGASGNTGRIVAERLLAQGEKVRVLGRDAARLQELASRGADVATGDPRDRAFLTRAFQGVEAAYTLLPSDTTAPDLRGDQDRVGEATSGALGASAVRRVVLLSSLGAELTSGTGPIAGLHAQEERLKALPGIDLLALRAGYFFENSFATLGLIKHQGINAGAIAGSLAIPMVATRDIGAAAAAALHARDFRGVAIREVLGPRDLTLDEVTRILGSRLGKPDLEYVQFPYAAFVEALVQTGISRSAAQAYAEMARAMNERRIHSTQGRSAHTSTPTRFEDFAEVLARAYAHV